MWRIRLARELPRYLLCALAAAGILASARFALAPPRPVAVPAPARGPVPPDRAAEAYAVLFARRYLTWDTAAPEAGARALEAFAGPGVEADTGRVLPPAGEENVQWAEVVQARERAPGEHVYTVAAQTDAAGVLYLAVAVTRHPGEGIALAGYPAFVGPPAAGPAAATAPMREVTDTALATVLTRALRNYLAASPEELAADLASGAHVSPPALALSLDSVQRLSWSADGRSVLALVQAHDARGARFTLDYELEVLMAQGRWEVSAVEMDPDA